MGRPGQKMIGIYVDEDLYKEIRQSARMRGQTIKQFLIGLYNRSKEDKEQLVLLRQISMKLKLPVVSDGSSQDELNVFSDYLMSIPHPRQRMSIKETLRVILSLGGQATSSQIKEARGFTRSTAADRQIEKLVKDGILVKDNRIRPYVVRIVPGVLSVGKPGHESDLDGSIVH